ncbi:MAG TPA: hypothetical protein VMU19_02540 [Bryobacteraceae bacterium]|nr:hypothetical protein [Bryobacteraceae bacterium]
MRYRHIANAISILIAGAALASADSIVLPDLGLFELPAIDAAAASGSWDAAGPEADSSAADGVTSSEFSVSYTDVDLGAVVLDAALLEDLNLPRLTELPEFESAVLADDNDGAWQADPFGVPLPVVTPEPLTLVLAGGGLTALALWRARKRSKL